MLSGKELFKALKDSTYLSKIEDTILPDFAIRMMLYSKTLPKKFDQKMSGDVDVLYCDYENYLGIGKYLQLPALSSKDVSPVIESYFTGYEGIAKRLGNVEVFPEFKRLFEKYYICFRNMVIANKIKAFLLTGLVGVYEAAILQLSLDMNIPVFCCQHGLYSKLFPHKKLLKNVIFFASGNEESMILKKNGISRDHIFITGSPFFDKVAKYRDMRAFFGNKIIRRPRKKIVILAQPLIDGEIDKKKYIERLEIIKRDFKDYDLLIRLHPRDRDVMFYKKMGFRVDEMIGKDSLYKLFINAYTVIGFGSTAEIEAMMIGVPVIVYGDVRFKHLDHKYIRVDVTKQRTYIQKNFKIDGCSKCNMENKINELLASERHQAVAQ